jgi:hypothetical protein
MAFFAIRGHPGVHSTFAEIIGFATGVDNCPLPVGSLAYFLAAIGDQLAAATQRTGTPTVGGGAAVGNKRARDEETADGHRTK